MNYLISKPYLNILIAILISTSISAKSLIPFDLINGLIIVEAEIDGKKGNYILDSGSNGILLNSNSLKSDISYQSLSGEIEGSETIISSLKLGKFESQELLGFSTDLSNLEIYVNQNLAGILSIQIFIPHSLVFDFENSTLIISEEYLNTESLEDLKCIPYRFIEDLPIGVININGKEELFVLDTGATSHFINKDFLSSLSNKIVKSGRTTILFTASDSKDVTEEYENIPLGSLGIIKAFSKDFTHISKEIGANISGILSMSKLSKKSVYFDVVNRKLYY